MSNKKMQTSIISSEHKLQKALIVIIILMYIAVLAFNWNRLHYGVELTDESYYVADAYIVSEGAIPVTNLWSQAPGHSLLYWPLVKLYTLFSGGTEGIIFYMRQMFFVYKALVSGVIVLLLNRTFPLALSMLAPFPYLTLSIMSIDNFSYNTLSLSLLLVSCVLLFLSLRREEKYYRQFAFIGGIIMALTILAHVMLLFTAIYVFFMLLFFEIKNYRAWFRSGSFIAGGILVGIVVTAYLSVLSGGIAPVIDGISQCLRASYFDQLSPSWQDNIAAIKYTLILFRDFLIRGTFVFIGFFIISWFFCKQKFNLKTLFVISLFITLILNTLILIARYNASDLQLNVNFCLAYTLVLLLFAAGWKAYGMLVPLIFSPFLVTLLLNIPFNISTIYKRGYILVSGTMLCILLTYFSLERISIPPLTFVKKSAIAYTCTIILAGVISAAYMLSYYTYVYRDSPMAELAYKVEKGVYRGLYTTETRGKALIYLEDEIQKVTDSQDKVLFLVHMPAAYMMTQAEHCTHATWYEPLYGDFWFYDYFEATGKEPTKIIYVQTHAGYDVTNSFKYINLHYKQTYANNADLFAIVVYERI